MSEPTTAAGRALLDDLFTNQRERPLVSVELIRDAILAIEAAPPALDVGRLAQAMRAAEPFMKSFGGDDCDCPQDEATEGHNQCYGHDRRDEQAAAVAAEYARQEQNDD